jgi:MoaA/NifB/PqqE/SkfB family radical SAM enzyme
MRSIPTSRYLQVAKYLMKNWSTGEAIYPFYCSFKLTRRCNFRCSFCNCWHLAKTWKDIPTESVKKIIDNIASSSILLCSFEGGEPLVREDIKEILQYQSTKPFYLLFTTSERDLLTKYPMDEYAKYMDFLHISIDEGHENMFMYDQLEEFTKWGPIVTIQIVVTKDTIDALEHKIQRCYEAGVKAVVMVAAHLKNTKDHYPDIRKVSEKGLEMKRKYPGVIISPDEYFHRVLEPHACNASSIIVDADGYLFYPCRVKEQKTIDLAKESLIEFLGSPRAAELRTEMKACDANCGWYQYYATQSFTSIGETIGSLRPYFRDILNGGRQPEAKKKAKAAA